MASSSPPPSSSSSSYTAPVTEAANDEPAGDLRALVSSYSSRAWRALRSYLPSTGSAPLSTIVSSLYPRRARRRKPGLPLPLRSALRSVAPAAEASAAFATMEVILESVLSHLHVVNESLLFWQNRAEGSNARKIYFMIFERGPQAFIDGAFQVLSRRISDGSPMQYLYHSASNTIFERIFVLTSLQQCLATFLAEIHMEVYRISGQISSDSERSVPFMLISINELFSKLEASINTLPDESKSGHLILSNGAKLCVLFERIPEVNQEQTIWSDRELRDATNLVHRNLRRLESYLSYILSSCRKPGRMTLYWLRYTCGAVGLSLLSFWLLRHSSLMGSSDIDNWIREGKESAVAFYNDHVEMPILSIRDELFETFRRRHKGVMELEEVKLTENSLHRMLLAFCEQANGQKLPHSTSDQELLEIVMTRYEKEVMHPLQNLISGELARAMLIQIQKLKLDLEMAMLELDQILKANEINFAILAALPAFFLSFLLLMLVKAWVLQDKGTEGKGRIARRQRRLLVVELEKQLMQYQTLVDRGMFEESRSIFGLLLYTLDHLYKAVERHAKETGEWMSLRQDIIDLANPDMQTKYKLGVVSRMGGMYDCLLPSSKHRR